MGELIRLDESLAEVLETMEDRDEAERLLQVILAARGRHPASRPLERKPTSVGDPGASTSLPA